MSLMSPKSGASGVKRPQHLEFSTRVQNGKCVEAPKGHVIQNVCPKGASDGDRLLNSEETKGCERKKGMPRKPVRGAGGNKVRKNGYRGL